MVHFIQLPHVEEGYAIGCCKVFERNPSGLCDDPEQTMLVPFEYYFELLVVEEDSTIYFT